MGLVGFICEKFTATSLHCGFYGLLTAYSYTLVVYYIVKKTTFKLFRFLFNVILRYLLPFYCLQDIIVLSDLLEKLDLFSAFQKVS